MLMTENTIQLKIRAWGCKIKSKIQAELALANPKLKQGEVLNLELILNFDVEDLPKSLEIAIEPKQTSGFTLEKPVIHESLEPNMKIGVPLKYVDGKPGEHRVDINFRHAEYGTQLATVQPITFLLSAPQIDIAYCRSDIAKISKGQKFNIQVGFNSPAPQKIRGIVYGRLIAQDELVHKMYELEPKRISIVGEKDLIWHLEVPLDETKTGRLKAIIEFKSKDTFSKKEFDNLIEIRYPRALQVLSLQSSLEVVSAGDELEVKAELENIGLEEIDFEVYTEVGFKDQKLNATDENDHKSQWILPTQKFTLTPDNTKQLSWPWKLPEKLSIGKYISNLHWKDLKTNSKHKFTQDLCEVKKHHEIRIHDVIPSSESFSVGNEAEVKILLSDSGTRPNEDLSIDCRIFDILNQEIFKKSANIKLSETVFEFDLAWPLSSNLDSGKYDLFIQISLGDRELLTRKFSKILNIEMPVKLDLHLMLPRLLELDPELAKYSLENEEVVEEIQHRSLSIYRLNSNTHFFRTDNELIRYSMDEKSSNDQLQSFGNGLLSYLVMQRYLTPKLIKEELNYWSRLGYSWSTMILNDDSVLKLKDTKKLRNLSKNKTILALSETLASSLFKPITAKDSLKKSHGVALDEIFKSSLLENKSITNTDDFKLLHSILNFLSEYPRDTKSNLNKSKALKGPKTLKFARTKLKGQNKSIEPLETLWTILNNSVKFRKQVNSNQLQNKYNRFMASLLTEVRKGRVRRAPDKNKWRVLRAIYSYLLSYEISEIIKLLRLAQKEKAITPNRLIKLVLLIIIYYFTNMNYYKTQSHFDPNLAREKVSDEINMAFGELKKMGNTYWSLHKKWQIKCRNYLKNMYKRANLAFVREHVKITTNPVILRGLRGAPGKTKVILGNDGPRAIVVYPYLALPSIHWNLIEPEAAVVNNVYNLKRIVISPKQTKEISIRISFPQSLSFPGYTGILKLNAKPIKLLNELD